MQGAACSIGAIFEPDLTGVSRPESFIYYMLQGYTFAEAASLANPSIGWMNIQIGDPLYAPLKQKALVHDTQFPVLVNGFPTVTLGSDPTSRVINAMVQDTPLKLRRRESFCGLRTRYQLWDNRFNPKKAIGVDTPLLYPDCNSM